MGLFHPLNLGIFQNVQIVQNCTGVTVLKEFHSPFTPRSGGFAGSVQISGFAGNKKNSWIGGFWGGFHSCGSCGFWGISGAFLGLFPSLKSGDFSKCSNLSKPYGDNGFETFFYVSVFTPESGGFSGFSFRWFLVGFGEISQFFQKRT